MSTHTGKCFRDFIYDLLMHALPKFDFKWFERYEHLRMSKKVFMAEFGDAVMLLRKRHAIEYMERISGIPEMKTASDVYCYIIKFCERNFKGRIPLMELFGFFAFILDLAVYCICELEWEVFNEAMDDISDVFNKYVSEYFTIVGGWYALYSVAGQYATYVQILNNLNTTEALAAAM